MKSFSPLYFLFATTLFVSFSCNRIDTDSKQSDNKTESVTLKCTTIPASNVLSTSAMLNGFLSITGLPQKTETVEAVFYYSSDETDASAIVQGGTKVSAGSFTLDDCAFNAVVNGLSVNTEYHFVASVIVGGKEMTGSVLSFRTALKSTELTETGAASDITEISATLTSYANPTPEMSDVMLGIIYSQEGTPTVDNGKTLYAKELDENNSYKFSVKDLIPGTQYYYRSFVKYGGVYRYGKVLSFKTYDLIIETLEADTYDDLYGLKLKGRFSFTSNTEFDVVCGFHCNSGKRSLEDLTNESYSKEDIVASADENGTFSSALLRYGGTYSYVFYVKIFNRKYYGTVKTSSTKRLQFRLNDWFLTDGGAYFNGEIVNNLRSKAWKWFNQWGAKIYAYDSFQRAQSGSPLFIKTGSLFIRASSSLETFEIACSNVKEYGPVFEPGKYYIKIAYYYDDMQRDKVEVLSDEIYEVTMEKR